MENQILENQNQVKNIYDNDTKRSLINIGKYVLIYVLAGNIINTIFKAIYNKIAITEKINLGDFQNQYADLYKADAHLSLTILIVLAPILIFFIYWDLKMVNQATDKIQAETTITNQVLNWIMFSLSSVTILSYLIYIVYILIGSSWTTAGILQAITVLIVSGLLAFFSGNLLKKQNPEDYRLIKAIFNYMFILFIIIGLVVGFTFANPKVLNEGKNLQQESTNNIY